MIMSHLFFYSLLIHARKAAWLGMLVTRRRAAWNALGVIAFFLSPPVWMSPFLVILYSPALSLLPPSVRAAQISFIYPIQVHLEGFAVYFLPYALSFTSVIDAVYPSRVYSYLI